MNRFNGYPRLAICFFLLIISAVFGAEKNFYIQAIRIDAPPHVDGNLNDTCWMNIPSIGRFLTLYQQQPTQFETQVRCAYDKTNLYFAFHCREKEKNLKRQAKKHNDAVYYDSCIELFLVPSPKPAELRGLPQGQQNFHLIFNTIGTKYEQRGTWAPNDWNPKWKVSVRVNPEYWEAEVAIPFSSLDAAEPKNMAMWQIQIGRSSFDEKSGEYSTLFLSKGAYRNEAHFGSLVFVQHPGAKDVNRLIDRKKLFGPILERIDKQLGAIKDDNDKAIYQRLMMLRKKRWNLASKLAHISNNNYHAQRKTLLTAFQTLDDNAKTLRLEAITSSLMRRNLKLAITPHKAITDNQKVLPDYIPSADSLGKPVFIRLCPNEFEPGTFVIWSPKPIKNVTCTVSNFKGLNTDCIDIRWVKCWYQGGSKEIEITGKELTPELLLKNPNLIKVDYKKEENLLGYDSKHVPPRKKRPDDAKVLKPLKNLPAHFAQQVWLTVNVPKGTQPGKYLGNVNVLIEGAVEGTIPLEIEVLGFDLLPPVIESGLYTSTTWGPRWKAKSPELAFKEMKNLVEHGVTFVDVREYADDMKVVLPMMRKAGLQTDPLYISNCAIPQAVRSTAHNIKAFRKVNSPEAVRIRGEKWIQTAKQLGIKEVYLYLLDEAKGDLLASEREAAKVIHDLGAKTWVACSHGFFDRAGNFIDMAVVAGGPSKSLAKKVHKVGGKIYCYANPQAGAECPETYRRNFGLLLWQKDYDGAMDFGYNWSMGKDPYNDFDHPRWKDHLMAYPTQSGVIDTIQWEGWREGVDDCRYLATLQYWIQKAKKEGNTQAAKNASQWIRKIKKTPLKDLDTLRLKMIEYIKTCKKKES